MDNAPGVLIASQRVQRAAPVPRLRLLTELEPRHRVFFHNLADLLLSRRVPQIPVTSRPAPFWNDVFVPSGAPWSAFLESMLWHLMLLILCVWGQSRVWEPVKLFPQRDAVHKSIMYYPLKEAFPAAEGRAPSVPARSRAKHASAHQPAHQPAMPVTPERRPGLVTPPDIKQATARLPNFLGSHTVTPMVPFSATAGPRRNALTGPSVVVAPPPQVDKDADHAAARRLALPQASVVAPAPELGGPPAGRAVKAPNTGGLRVVPPPPSVQSAGNSAGRLGKLSGAGPNVVPPPPSVHGAHNAAGVARLGSMAGAGSQVVPPPPSVAGTGRRDLLSPAGSQVVPPPPSVQGAGAPAGSARLGSLSGAAPQVVPPPPLVAGTGRRDLLSPTGSQVVPPPPSVESAAHTGARGRLPSLSGDGSGDGSPIVTPPSPVEGANNSGARKILEPMDPLPMDAASDPPANSETPPTIEELPLGLLGVVFAAPGSSFFSNFEVFVAKRRVGKDQLQLIKLVYEFLPYQRRLSEYDLNNLPPRVIKLRVTPDPNCDESLGQIMQVHIDPSLPATEYPKLPAALRSSNLNAVLPCYRTTADDFLKAMSRGQ
jgi:hypothetical protein